MAISFVAAGAVATGTSPTVALPAGYAQGDLLVIAVAANAAVTTPSGWTLVGSQLTNPRIYLYYKFATGSEASVAVTVASTTTTAVMLAYRGVSATDTVSTGTTATSTTIATGTLTTSYANEYVVSAYAMTIGAATWTAPASTTSRVNSAGTAALDGLLIVDEAKAAAGVSTARTATSSVSKALAAISFSIIPSGRYWVGGSGTWTTTTTNWSFSSGGASGAPAPTAQDNVAFDSATTYTVTCTGALTCNDITVSAGTVTFAQGTSPTFAISGSMSLVAATVWSATGGLTFNATSTGKTVTTNGVVIGNGVRADITFSGTGGGWTLGSAFTTNGVTIFQTGTFSTGNYAMSLGGSVYYMTVSGAAVSFGSSTVTLPDGTANCSSGSIDLGTSTVTVSGGSWAMNGTTITAGTSQINCSLNSPTFAGGGQTYYNVSFTSTALSTATVTGANTFNNFTAVANTSSSEGSILLGADQTINGTLTFSASSNATMRRFVRSDTIGTTRTLTCAAVAALADVDFQDITIAGAAAPVSGTRLGDCKGNSGITFGAGTTKYWNLAAGGTWQSTAWATSSGGTTNINNFPLAQDTCIFEATGLNSGVTITINVPYNIGAIDMSARTSNTMTLATGTAIPTIYGNWINGTGTTLSGTGTLTFAGRGSQTITSAGKTFTQNLTVNSPSGSVTLQDALTSGSITVTYGTLTTNNFNVTASTLSSTNTNTRTINLGSSTVTFTASGAIFNAAVSTNLTVTGTGTISATSASSKSFIGGGIQTYPTLNQGGAGALTITGSNGFANITNTYSATGATSILFTAGTTSTFTAWNASGASGNLLTISSSSAATHTLSKASGIVSANYLSLTNSIATGGATWYAGANSTNVSGNTGWIFSSAPTNSGNFFMLF